MKSHKLEAINHVRRSAYWIGAAAINGAVEPYTNSTVGSACGWAVIGVALGNAIHHVTKAVQNYRTEDKPQPATPKHSQFQYNQKGFSDRYNAEVEYLAHRVTKHFDKMGATEVTYFDIAPETRSVTIKTIADEMFQTRLSEGYELSMHQICDGILGAALTMGIYKQAPIFAAPIR